MLLSVVVLAVLASAQGRAVNISNTWVLPEEGFPVFYRYFRDRISWYEADAVCQFHHANLVTVDTTAQYDAVRAYLKELDISSAVWVGLIRSNPDGDFTWTDYRGLSGEGYWSSAPDARSAPLCAAADPAADYRWEARACGGPTVASFICELPVPQWALGNEGCMVRALPALTILYLPESAAVQLTADCGMAGVKKVQCTGNVKREDLLKELSCAVEDEMSTGSIISTGSYWPVSTDTAFTDQDVTNEVTTDESVSTEHETDPNQSNVVTPTTLPRFIYSQSQYKIQAKDDGANNLNSFFDKNMNLEDHDNNMQSNFIPKTLNDDNVLTNDELEKLEDERHKQHKMLHEEIARVGNVDNIFTQPTDHFIPPLVMAKARISDDMTVLSLAEKHAQQLAEKQFSKQTLNNNAVDHYYSGNHSSLSKTSMEDNNKPLIATIKPTKFKESKQEFSKNDTPKKYTNEKYNDVKLKISKLADKKVLESSKYNLTPVAFMSTTEMATDRIETVTSTKKVFAENMTKSRSLLDDDIGMELKVTLNDAPSTSDEQPSFSGDVPKLETIKLQTNSRDGLKQTSTQTIVTASTSIPVKETDATTLKTPLIDNITTQHDIIKITIISDDKVNTTVFEVTTNMPVFKDTSTSVPFITAHINKLPDNGHTVTTETPEIITTSPESRQETINPIASTSTVKANTQSENLTTAQSVFVSTEVKSSTETASTLKTAVDPVQSTQKASTTTSLPITLELNNTNINITNLHNTNISIESGEKIDLNSSEYHEIIMNMTDHQQNGEEDSTEDDFQSPLLSGAMEPVRRPPRTRRPQQPPRNKFIPFRVIG